MRLSSLMRLAAAVPVAVALLACGLDPGGQSDVPGGGSGDDGGQLDGSLPRTDGGHVDGSHGGGDAPGGDGPSPSTDARSDAPLPDGSSDAPHDGPPTDAPHDAPHDSCVSSGTEVCNDGIDNDCNGLIDCLDPGCTSGGWSCAPTAPGGWALVEFAGNARPTCDTSFGTATDAVEGPTGAPATCGCGCTVDANNKGTCLKGSMDVFYNGSTSACPMLSFQLASNDGACNPFPGIGGGNFNSVPGAMAKITPLPYTAGACSTSVNKTVPPVTYAGQGRACALATGTGTGCPGGQACTPKPSAPFGVCVMKAGDQASCPNPAVFSVKHTLGNSVADTRDCSACGACTTTATCGNTKLTDFEDGQCATSGGGHATLNVVADGNCDANTETQSHQYSAYRYSAEIQNLACSASGSAPTGSVAMAGQVTTVCCP